MIMTEHQNDGYINALNDTSKKVDTSGMIPLRPGFTPSDLDVICARGKLIYDHEGNRRFRELVKHHLPTYSECVTKMQKTRVVSHIIETVRGRSPEGGFVKNVKGQWYEVGDRRAKEKTGQTMRDLLHTRYTSSTKAKARARRHLREFRGMDRHLDLREDREVGQHHLNVLPPRYVSGQGDFLRQRAISSQQTMGGSLDTYANHVNNHGFHFPMAANAFGPQSQSSNNFDVDPLPLNSDVVNFQFDEEQPAKVSEESFSVAMDKLFEIYEV